MSTSTKHILIHRISNAPRDVLAIENDFHLKGLAKRLGVSFGSAKHAQRVELLLAALEARAPRDRLGIILNTSAKAYPSDHAKIAAQLGARHVMKAGSTTKACLTDLANRLAMVPDAEVADFLESLWLGDEAAWTAPQCGAGRFELDFEALYLHAMLHELTPAIRAPMIALISLRVRIIYDGHRMPERGRRREITDLALRFLGGDLGGPVATRLGDVNCDLPDALGFPFSTVMGDRAPKAGMIHVFTHPEIAAGYAEGTGGESTAW